jgi:Pyruvate/2-oxoacid:ferredoxin oxidoreductase delta subunit
MGSNDPKFKGWQPATNEKVAKLESEIQNRLDSIQKIIINQENIKSYLCYACLNYCPMQEVQIKTKIYMKSYTEENERYSHPYATAEDIAAQKQTRG